MMRELVMVTLAVAVAGIHASAQAPKNLSALPPIAFEHVYRHLRHLQNLDTAAASAGRPSKLAAYYKNLASLTQQQTDALRAVSLAALSELESLDNEARSLIVKFRTEVRARVAAGQKLPEAPPQLAALQSSRRAVLAKYRGNLSQALGPAAFGRLEQALIKKAKVGPQATVPNPGTGR